MVKKFTLPSNEVFLGLIDMASGILAEELFAYFFAKFNQLFTLGSQMTEENWKKEKYLDVWLFNKGYQWSCRVNFDLAYSGDYVLTQKR